MPISFSKSSAPVTELGVLNMRSCQHLSPLLLSLPQICLGAAFTHREETHHATEVLVLVSWYKPPSSFSELRLPAKKKDLTTAVRDVCHWRTPQTRACALISCLWQMLGTAMSISRQRGVSLDVCLPALFYRYYLISPTHTRETKMTPSGVGLHSPPDLPLRSMMMSRGV